MDKAEGSVLTEEKVDDVNKILDDLEVKDSEDEEEFKDAFDEDYIDECVLKDIEVDLSPEQIEERRLQSLEFKEEGNSLFKENNFTDARHKYTEALRICPLSSEKERSVLFANRAACSMKEERRAQAIDDCTKAIELNPTYLKAIKRRAVVYEKDEKLDESLADYKTCLEMDPSDKQAAEAVQRLPAEINEKNEKLKTEMLGKLKDLGNTILRPFGLSTNNFQMQQDPSTGGYSFNFVQNNK